MVPNSVELSCVCVCASPPFPTLFPPFSPLLQTISVLNPFQATDPSILSELDLAGPLLFCLMYGTVLLFVSPSLPPSLPPSLLTPLPFLPPSLPPSSHHYPSDWQGSLWLHLWSGVARMRYYVLGAEPDE